MSDPSYRPSLHKHSYSAPNEAIRASEYIAVGVCRQSRAGTDPGPRPNPEENRSNASAIPRHLPTPRVPLIVPQKGCSVYSYKNSNESSGYIANPPASSSHAATEIERSTSSHLALPSRSRHRRHDSGLDMQETSAAKQTTANLVTQTPSQSNMTTSNEAGSDVSNVEQVLSESSILDGMVAALSMQDLSSGESSTPTLSRASVNDGNFEPTVAALLEVLRQWTGRTGDTSILQTLMRDISRLNTRQMRRLAQTRGVDHPELDSNASYVTSPSHTSRLPLRGNTNQPAPERAKGKQASNQVRQAVKLANNGQTNSARLRCPVFFDEESGGCKALHACIRDIT